MECEYPAPKLCPDWVFSNSSNVHGCKDKEWFRDYRPFRSVAVGSGDKQMEVLGVGTVYLPVRRSPDMGGVYAHSTLRLTDVLHIPSMPCNIVGGPILDDYPVFSMCCKAKSKGTIYDADNNPAAYFRPDSPLFSIQISEPPFGPEVGPSVLDSDANHYINLFWPVLERNRFDNIGSRETSGHAVPVNGQDAPYTPDELKWLERNYGGEFNFLRDHGLGMYNEENRKEGRVIVRALMSPDL